MSACDHLIAIVAFSALLAGACSGKDSCLRNSDCPSGQGCTSGKCALLTPTPPADANDDVLDAGADADADARDADAADREASADAVVERDAPQVDATDATHDVTDAGSDSSD